MLAQLVFAVSAWSLWRQGCIELELYQRDLLGGLFPQMTATAVWISIRREGNYLQSLGRFERSVMVAADAANDVREIIRAWLGGVVADPWSRIIDGIRMEAIERGYLIPKNAADREMLRARSDQPADDVGQIRSSSEGPVGRPFKPSVVQPDCVQIGWLQGQFQEFTVRWGEFRDESGELYRLLLSECGAGLQRCEETEDR